MSQFKLYKELVSGLDKYIAVKVNFNSYWLMELMYVAAVRLKGHFLFFFFTILININFIYESTSKCVIYLVLEYNA